MRRGGQTECSGDFGERLRRVRGRDAQFYQRHIGAGGLRGHGDGEPGVAGIEGDAFGDGARGGVADAQGDRPGAGGELAGASQVGGGGKEESVAGDPLRKQGARDFALPLQQHGVDGGAIHRQCQSFAHARILEARGEHQCQHAHGRGGPHSAAGRLAA